MIFISKNPLLILALLIVATVSLRLAGYGHAEMANGVPILALALCGGWIRRPLVGRLAASFGGLLLGDVLINIRSAMDFPDMSWQSLFFGPSALIKYAVYAAVFTLACYLGRRAHLPWLLAICPPASLLFYGIMNTASWATSVPPYAYAKTFAGWWQAQTLGLPGFPPSYLFLRNALVSDFLFCALFVAAVYWLPARLRARLPGSAAA